MGVLEAVHCAFNLWVFWYSLGCPIFIFYRQHKPFLAKASLEACSWKKKSEWTQWRCWEMAPSSAYSISVQRILREARQRVACVRCLLWHAAPAAARWLHCRTTAVLHTLRFARPLSWRSCSSGATGKLPLGSAMEIFGASFFLR